MTTMQADATLPEHRNTAPEQGIGPGTPGIAGNGDADRAKIERKILFFLVGGMLVLVGAVASWLGWAAQEVADIPMAIGAGLLAIPLFIEAWKELRAGKPGSASLVALAIIAALAIQSYGIAGFLAFILLLAEQFVKRTAWGAKHAIAQLVRLTPDVARLVDNGKEREVKVSTVRVGQIIRVRPGENLPVDGEIVTGRSTLNQASLTGESAPVEAEPGSMVYAGTTNLTGVLELRATNVGEDTTIGKVSGLIREAERSKTPRQLIIEQVAAYFVPVVITVAGLVLFFTHDVTKAITVLVVATPSPLLLSSPTAMVAAFAAAARLGLMIKETRYLEASANIDTVVLDKTGTLTTGVFAVSRLAPAKGVNGAALLQAAADAEQHSNHPLAKSILQTALKARVTPSSDSEHAEEMHGRGVKVRVGGNEICAGRGAWLAELQPAVKDAIEKTDRELEGMTAVHVLHGGQYLGAVGLEDKLRDDAKEVVKRFREVGVRFVAIFTGDRTPVAQRVGAAVEADAVEAELLPEEKHDRLRAMTARGRKVLMVGDGINDGPSLAIADVGVAMGLSGSDIAANSAGVALMHDDLSRIPFLIELARRTRAVITQNIVASMVIAILGLALAATATLSLWLAPLFQIVGGIFVIGNSFRLVRQGEDETTSE